MALISTLKGRTLKGRTLVLAAPSGGLEPAVLPISAASGVVDHPAAIAFTTGGIAVAAGATLGHSTTAAFTASSVAIASSSTLAHTATTAFTTDTSAIASSATLGHSESTAFTTDGVTVNASASIIVDHPATIAFTADGVGVAASSALWHTASSVIAIGDITASAGATVGHGAAVGSTTDSVFVAGSASVVSVGIEEPLLHGGLPPQFVKTKVKKREDVEAVVREAFDKVLGITTSPEVVQEVIEEAEIAVRIKLPEYDLQAEQTIRIMIENIGRQLERYKAANDEEMDDEEALLMVM